jgi:pyridinium-3,5-bisthiocarboxylic acid mononucleotide nickel chelatase
LKEEALRGRHLHLEPTSGIAGLGVPGLRTSFARRRRGAFVGRGFDVTWPGKAQKARPRTVAHAHPHDDTHAHDHGDHGHGAHAHGRGADVHGHDAKHAHRDYAEIRRLLARARLDADALALAEDIFARIAEVEAALHGTRVERVTFHEVGAYDSIADIVGFSAALVWLAPASVGSLPVVVGTGRARVAHGAVPVPAPATAALLLGMPIIAEGEGELTTPTGAGLLAAVVDTFGPLPPMRIEAIGYGAGTRELADRANVLRVVAGTPLGAADVVAAPEVVRLEANLDDLSPALVATLCEALFAAGAVDVWTTPIVMKKGRAAVEVTALAAPAAVAAVRAAFFRHSTTLGVRAQGMARTVLARAFETVRTPHGPVRIKIAALDGEVLGANPELEDCRRLAARAGVPVHAVFTAALVAAQTFLTAAGTPPRGKRTRRA